MRQGRSGTSMPSSGWTRRLICSMSTSGVSASLFYLIASSINLSISKAGLKACLVSVSGGVDSAVTIALMKHAQQKKGSPIQRVIGMSTQPSLPPLPSHLYIISTITNTLTVIHHLIPCFISRYCTTYQVYREDLAESSLA